MIHHVDNLLRHLLLDQVDELTSDLQVRFQPPDDAWRTYVGALSGGPMGTPVNAVNGYLVDLRENSQLRTNHRLKRRDRGVAHESFAPRRLDCHYLLTAWSPAAVSPAVEPTLDEHALLYKVVSTFMNHETLVPRDVYGGALPPGFPQELENAELPVVITPPEGFAHYGDFWGTMGTDHRWKPIAYLVTTVPVALIDVMSTPVVTTKITEYRVGDGPAAEVVVQIGGVVRDATVAPLPSGEAPPVADARVTLRSPTGGRRQSTRTDGFGRFTFAGLTSGAWELSASSSQHANITRSVTVPSPSGEYDLTFT